LPGNIVEAVIKPQVDSELVAELIKEAKSSTLPANAQIEGAEVFVRLTRLTDIYKPASEANRTRTYVLKFKRINGELEFVSIDED
jgi:hypothetical protein